MINFFSMSRKSSKGFTLIELLVVISIIALLSSIILASLNGARQKGVTASIIQFADNNYHKLGAGMLLSLNFNECSTSNLNCSAVPVDSSGNFKTSTSVSHSSNTPFGDNGSSFNTNNGGTYIQLNSNSGGNIGLSDTSGFTESVWFNTLGSQFDKFGNAENLIAPSIYNTTGGSLNSYISISADMKTVNCYFTINVSAPFNSDSNWHNVTCVDDKNGNITLYLDGKLVNSVVGGFNNIAGLLTPLYVGYAPAGAASIFSGLIDNVQIFSGSLLASNVQKLYAEGLKNHQNLAEK